MLLKQQLLFIGIFFLARSYSTAQIKVVEEKKIEHNGAVGRLPRRFMCLMALLILML